MKEEEKVAVTAYIELNDSYTDVKQTTANVYAYCKGGELPNDKTTSSSVKSYYSNLKYVWSFYKNDSSSAFYTSDKTSNSYYYHDCTNTDSNGVLDVGTDTQIKVKVKTYCTEKTDTYRYESNENGGGSWVYDNTKYDYEYEITNGSDTSSNLSIYTSNDKVSTDFWGNPSTGDYIDEHITKDNVDDWIEQLGIWTSWKEQSDFYSSYNDTTKITTVTVPNRKTTNTADRVTISSPIIDDDITADWYNTCSDGCNGTYSVNRYDQYISAVHFTDLADKVTTWT